MLSAIRASNRTIVDLTNLIITIMGYSKGYDFVYRREESRVLLNEPSEGDFEIAAVMVEYRNGKEVSRDKYVADGCWVDAHTENAYEKAIELRKGT